ncbi:MAG: apolipoprotein N-acyltransferase [Candidatus Rokubacteria bacterium]|nr:apolipoprotein N-acyltransferase [Candidatus Rokubacteria bacterium]MBI3827766.1 apolipoprotein N-acyltransferase [Candidatus Rokubacteria bacterium]
MHERWLWALTASASGVLLALAFPGTDLEAAAWIVLAPPLALALRTPPRAAFGWAWLAGTVFFLILLRWLDFTFTMYSAIPWPLTWGPLLMLAAYCGLYVGAVHALVALLARRGAPALALATVPFAWVAGEWVRGHLMGGFPWGSLGYSQYRTLLVIQIAELGGVYAVSFVVAAVNAALAAAVSLPRPRALTAVALAAGLVAATLGFGWGRLAEPAPAGEIPIALMQPAIEQPLKFDPSHAGRTLATYVALTERAARERPALIVWPETAAPAPVRHDPALLAAVQALERRVGVPLLIGSLDVRGTSQPRYLNTAFLLTDRGLQQRYDKMHLVPFGEYVPLASVIGFVRDWAEFIADLEPGTRADVFSGPPAPFGVVICYEGIFPELVREFVKGGARLMINMTNDGWFGRTVGPQQHLSMYPFRAVEHRTWVVRAANTGISAAIDPAGRIRESLSLYERANLVARVGLRQGETLYTRFGDWLAYVALAVTGLAAAALATGRP